MSRYGDTAVAAQDMPVPTIDVIERMPETGCDLERLKSCILYDADRNRVRFEDIMDAQYSSTIFVFLRHFLDYVTRDYAEDFAKIFKHELEKCSCRIVLIGCSPARHIKQFIEHTNCPHDIYCDSSRTIYRALGLHQRTTEFPQGPSPHVKTNSFIGFWQTVWRSMNTTQQGDPFQMGGQLIVDNKENLLFFHRDTHPYDHTPINDLLKVVGLPRVDFKTKYRIKDV